MGWPRNITTWSHGGFNIARHCQELGIAYPARGEEPCGQFDQWSLKMVRLMDQQPAVKELCDQDYRAALLAGSL